MKTIIERTNLFPKYDLRNISPLGEMLLFDIETTGLKKETTQLYLIGCGSFAADGSFEIRQWLAESAMDEREVLEEFVSFARGFKTLVHFNGDGFDIPYVAYKTEYYGLDFDFSGFESFDIYKKVKPLKKFLGLSRAGQKNVEEFLKIARDDEMNGGLLIPYYYEYERTRSELCEKLLLLHNRDDVAGMIQLVDILAYTDIFEGKYTFRNMERVNGSAGDWAVMEFELDNPVKVPVEFSFASESCMCKGKKQEDMSLCDTIVCAEGKLLQISVTVKNCEAKVRLENVADYFYLPAEDRVIHKDVAVFVDPKYRRKATAKNCFLKEQGSFLPEYLLQETENHPEPEQALKRKFLIEDSRGKLQLHFKADEVFGAGKDVVLSYAASVLEAIRRK